MPVSCCGARCAPCRRSGCVAHRPLPLRLAKSRFQRLLACTAPAGASRSGRFVRLGCPVSSLPINRLRQLPTPAHTYAPLYLPPAALPSLPKLELRSSLTATGIKIWDTPLGYPIFWHILHNLTQCNARSQSGAFAKRPDILQVLKNLFYKWNLFQQISYCSAYNHCKETPETADQQGVF